MLVVPTDSSLSTVSVVSFEVSPSIDVSIGASISVDAEGSISTPVSFDLVTISDKDDKSSDIIDSSDEEDASISLLIVTISSFKDNEIKSSGK
ncbi:unnamed protein product [[Candida] boidinii]|nr:unnamed protein product [[Candida] boidinii]